MIYGYCNEECKICGSEMIYEDTSFDHEFGTENQGFFYCDDCNCNTDVLNSKITHCSDINIGELTYSTFSMPDGVIVTMNNDIIFEFYNNNNGYEVADFISVLFGQNNEHMPRAHPTS